MVPVQCFGGSLRSELSRIHAVVAPPSRRLTAFKWGGASTFASAKKSLNGEPKARVRIDLTDFQRREPPGRRRSGNCIVPADNPIWLRAVATQAVILSKDEDFAEWVRRGRPGPPVVWLRVGNTSRRALLIWFTAFLPSIINDLQRGERLVEVR